LSKLGKTRFFSSSFSFLSKVKSDQRLPLWNRANEVEIFEGVECYLWKTYIHPIKVPRAIDFLMDKYFEAYAKHIPHVVRQWFLETNTFVLESGGPEIYYRTIKELNPAAKVIYVCSDPLSAIGTSSFVVRELMNYYPYYDGIRVPSKILAGEFPLSKNICYVPHGIDMNALDTTDISPYSQARNIVSVGNMLFDSSFFVEAANAFPDVLFHIIGGGKKAELLRGYSNIKIYGEMPFLETLPYIKYATAGVAPYQANLVAPYLTDTSMKLMQYEFYGLPAICPNVVVGNHAARIGYIPGNHESIVDAISKAMHVEHIRDDNLLAWSEVVSRILNAKAYPDTLI
jgi:2-beta-glucuronyltransferase